MEAVGSSETLVTYQLHGAMLYSRRKWFSYLYHDLYNLWAKFHIKKNVLQLFAFIASVVGIYRTWETKDWSFCAADSGYML
jgi:hypothetical protein